MESPMRQVRSASCPWRILGALAVVGLVNGAAAVDSHATDDKEKRASLSLKASPSIAFAPVRVVVSAELKGGDENSSELYCPSLEWEWGDGTTSEANVDCEPFTPGESEIRRRWTTSHSYNQAGNFRVRLRLKRGDKTLVSGSTNLQIRGGTPGFPD
jgi:hypothetical protein